MGSPPPPQQILPVEEAQILLRRGRQWGIQCADNTEKRRASRARSLSVGQHENRTPYQSPGDSTPLRPKLHRILRQAPVFYLAHTMGWTENPNGYRSPLNRWSRRLERCSIAA